MHGDPRDLTSTRAEHLGSLATIIAVFEMGWRWDVDHALDNKGVVGRMDATSEGSMDEEHDLLEAAVTPIDWMTVSDPDIREEMEAWVGRSKGSIKLRWHRGHPEKRKEESEFTEDDVCVFRADALAEEQSRGGLAVQTRWYIISQIRWT